MFGEEKYARRFEDPLSESVLAASSTVHSVKVITTVSMLFNRRRSRLAATPQLPTGAMETKRQIFTTSR